MTLSRFSNAVTDEAAKYAEVLGVPVPHTSLTVKPAGTTSKLFGLSEGWHLPSMKEYIRWVQFQDTDPLVNEYRVKGYPTRALKSIAGTTIVGFPTRPTICDIMPDEQIVTAGMASPEEQYLWVRLGEQFWIDGQTDPFDDKTGHGFGNQISYTLKYKPEVTDYEHFEKMLRKWQHRVRACSVMPQEDATGAAYAYLPHCCAFLCGSAIFGPCPRAMTSLECNSANGRCWRLAGHVSAVATIGYVDVLAGNSERSRVQTCELAKPDLAVMSQRCGTDFGQRIRPNMTFGDKCRRAATTPPAEDMRTMEPEGFPCASAGQIFEIS